jgi:hypothetical protein
MNSDTGVRVNDVESTGQLSRAGGGGESLGRRFVGQVGEDRRVTKRKKFHHKVHKVHEDKKVETGPRSFFVFFVAVVMSIAEISSPDRQ